MAEGSAGTLSGTEWDGGVSPYAVGHKKLGMWLFLASDTMTFAALLIGYSYVRIASGNWPTPFHFYPSVVFATVMTLVLLSSSLTMVFAVSASKKGKRRTAAKYIWLTAIGGFTFIVLHAKEWMNLIAEGVLPWSNPWGSPLFGGTFFALTGMHMFHVATGVIYLGVVALRTAGGKATHEEVEVSGLYWHFVDLVWMFVFPLVYLLSVQA
jgi:cytochrome c oxidase subunit III